MRLNADHLDHARRVADAILYEGYLLYPYHKGAQKNQVRFQFGVLMPPGYAAVDDCEPSASQTECLLECRDDAEVRVLVRFLQLQRRTVQSVSPDDGELHDAGTLYVDGTEYTSWDEAAEREQRVTAAVSSLLTGDKTLEFHIGSGESAEDLPDSRGRLAGRLIRQWSALDGVIRLHAERVAGPFQALRLRVQVENHTTSPAQLEARSDGLRHALIAAHSLIGIPGGTFLSMTDPPEWASAEIAACQNVGTWPVLAGPDDCRDLMLSSPVILYDHPEVAAESAGDLFDATEIDEILTLRTLTLTEAEKRQARATDSRAAELMDRLDDMPAEMLERMHGAIRYLRSAPAGASFAESGAGEPELGQPALQGRGQPAVGSLAAAGRALQPGDGLDWPEADITARPSVPWWDPGADASVSPADDYITVAGVRVARGSRVLMQPGSRRADAQDLFLAGREAVVEAVLQDVDGQVHLAVTPVDDPAADLQRSHGRFLYFAPDEVQPLEEQPGGMAEAT
ncbi:MAG TPA: hypothetical protein VEL03_06715 [Streptosporangiaceae bacterium]|nr:hypothetical protein [Streptosporangiaceae bacterium]